MTLQPLSTIRESTSSTSNISMSGEEVSDIYSITKIVGKGMGVVANTDIPPGRLIVEEKPLLNVPLTPSGDLPGRVFNDRSTNTYEIYQYNIDIMHYNFVALTNHF